MRRSVIGLSMLVAVSFCCGGCSRGAAAVRYTMTDNPTTRSGRGEPSADDERRPPAWILVDGNEGTFRADEKTNIPQLEWYLEKPVSTRPTFQLAVLNEVLGNNVGANFWLESVNLTTGQIVRYALAGQPGVFRPGRVYALSQPGEALVVRHYQADDAEGTIVQGVEPLPPGDYLLAASVKGDKQIEVLAATRFTVAE